MPKPTSLKELNEKIWYRLLKVIWGLFWLFVIGSILAINIFSYRSSFSYSFSTCESSIEKEKPYTDQQIADYAHQLETKGAEPNEIETFIKASKIDSKNHAIIQNYLNDEGIDRDKRVKVIEAMKAGQSEASLSSLITEKYGDRYGSIANAPSPSTYSPQDIAFLGALKSRGVGPEDAFARLRAVKTKTDPTLDSGLSTSSSIDNLCNKSASNSTESPLPSISIGLFISLLFFEGIRRIFYYIVLGNPDPNHDYKRLLMKLKNIITPKT